MDFTDLGSLGSSSSPHKNESHSSKKSSSKKRSMNSGRLRLMPLESSSGYEVGSNNNGSGNNNNQTSTGGSSSTASPMMPGFGKLKKITQKKELLEAVRKANSPIVLPTREPLGGGAPSGGQAGGQATGAIGSLRHESSSSSLAGGDPQDGATSATRDIESLEDGVRTSARKFNDHKMLADRRQRELNTLLDELRTLQLETQELSRLQNQDTPIAKQSLRIRQEIQECTTSMEEQMHVRRQLEHMMRRLQTGQLKIDAHLEAMTKAVDASHREADEVKLLCRQLEAGKSRAVQFLQDVQLQIQVERRARARELTDTEIRAKNAQKMEIWRLQRMQERAEMAAELRGDLSVEEEQRLMRCIESRERANEALHVANQTKSQMAADYEDVLAQLKVAMGAGSLQEVVQKIQAQVVTSVSLDKEKTQAEARLITVRQEKEHAVQSLNELKASGIGGIELNREVYNTLESEIQQAKATLKVNKAAYERLDGVIQAVRQGSFGLTQRLQAFDDVLDLSNPSEGSASGAPSPVMMSMSLQRMDNVDCLGLAELKLTKMLELIGQQSSSVNGFNGGGASGNGFGSGGSGSNDDDDGFDDAGASSRGGGADFLDERTAIWSPTTNNDPVLHKNNIRVQPGRKARLGNHVVDVDEELDAELARLNEPATIDSARSEVSVTSDGASEFMDVHVPSRDILKMSSSRHFAEVMRKKEMSEKQKVAAERGISDEEMMSKLRKKNQQEADARLATSPAKTKPLLGGPVVAKDGDALKSFAFVTQLHFNDLT